MHEFRHDWVVVCQDVRIDKRIGNRREPSEEYVVVDSPLRSRGGMSPGLMKTVLKYVREKGRNVVIVEIALQKIWTLRLLYTHRNTLGDIPRRFI